MRSVQISFDQPCKACLLSTTKIWPFHGKTYNKENGNTHEIEPEPLVQPFESKSIRCPI